MGRVQNKIALITGGSRGIGLATARLLASEGATVIITDILVDEGKSVADSIRGKFYALNVGNEHEWQGVIRAVGKEFGKLDILFNNAGIIGFSQKLGPQDPENISLKAWQYVHKINLDGAFLGCKYGISLMKDQGGSIINMSSRSGIVGIPGASAYASSKAAIRNHTKSVALYCAENGYNIRCNSLHPGAILTPLWDPMLGNTESERQEMITTISSTIPLGHMGEPMDVAYAVLYLGSEESKYITGIELTIDGGILAGSSASPKKHSSCKG
ncbi:MAG: short-chain dehydrogenase [Candidatus Amoebophilus sp. 36-38]|nr:MAG: short-chain dehydrogenase [Candidatus Amoebophilus sp. 36-38]